ncbi:unnamed protein product, partial [Chrysoparadoxa australica]
MRAFLFAATAALPYAATGFLSGATPSPGFVIPSQFGNVTEVVRIGQMAQLCYDVFSTASSDCDNDGGEEYLPKYKSNSEFNKKGLACLYKWKKDGPVLTEYDYRDQYELYAPIYSK